MARKQLDVAQVSRNHTCDIGNNAVNEAVDYKFTFSDLMIRTKGRGLVPLKPNDIQADWLDAVCPGWREGDAPGPLNGHRENILKARQFGFSTLLLAIMFLDTLARKNTYSLVVGHNAESTERLFQTVRTFYAHLPPGRRPRTGSATRREFVWPDLGSSFFVGQAGSRDFGRSSTINNLLATEVAFWPDPARLFPALLGAVPDSGNAFMESTANGLGTWHEKEYGRSKANLSTFRAWFYAWFRHPEYQATPGPDFEAQTWRLDDEERAKERVLVEKYGVSREQLQWRRTKMREPGMLLRFVQEYPSDDEEAFLNSGRTVYRGDWLRWQTQHHAEPLPLNGLPDAIRNAFGRELEQLRVYQAPQPGHFYVVGGDVAEGLVQGDFSALVVLDGETLDEVACYHGKPEPDVLGTYADALVQWFNSARCGIERNNHGFTTLAKLKDLETPNVFLADDGRRGWVTNAKTKPQIIDRLGVALREQLIKVRTPAARHEMRAYSNLASGGFGAPEGEHDDLVMAWAIALEIARRRLNGAVPLAPNPKSRNWRY